MFLLLNYGVYLVCINVCLLGCFFVGFVGLLFGFIGGCDSAECVA